MIEGYKFGEIVIDGKRYTRDVIIFPDRIDGSWWWKEGHELSEEDIKEVIKERPEVLIVGTGYHGCMRVLPETEQYVRANGIKLMVEKTERACEVCNQLSKSKRIIATLHLTC